MQQFSNVQIKIIVKVQLYDEFLNLCGSRILTLFECLPKKFRMIVNRQVVKDTVKVCMFKFTENMNELLRPKRSQVF